MCCKNIDMWLLCLCFAHLSPAWWQGSLCRPSVSSPHSWSCRLSLRFATFIEPSSCRLFFLHLLFLVPWFHPFSFPARLLLSQIFLWFLFLLSLSWDLCSTCCICTSCCFGGVNWYLHLVAAEDVASGGSSSLSLPSSLWLSWSLSRSAPTSRWDQSAQPLSVCCCVFPLGFSSARPSLLLVFFGASSAGSSTTHSSMAVTRFQV